MPAARPIRDRFWEKVRKTRGCWYWIGSIGGHGYGQISYNLLPVTAHRLSYELNVGPVPKGKWVLHSCDNKACVNPNHLFLGTRQDNTDDMLKKGRSWSQKDHAAVIRNGHKNRKFLPIMKGAANHKSKLTVAKVKAMRQIFDRGISFTAIAKRYGVTRTAVASVYYGRTWKHVGA